MNEFQAWVIKDFKGSKEIKMNDLDLMNNVVICDIREQCLFFVGHEPLEI